VKCPSGFLVLLSVFAVIAAVSLGCSRKEEPRKVILERQMTDSPQSLGPSPAMKKRLRVAIAAMISPKETLVSYNDLMTYIGNKMGMEVELVQRKTYEEVNELLKNNLLDIAFVCTGAYVKGHRDFDMEILVAPVTNGQTYYNSYIIVPADSPVRSMDGLKGKTFAFTDPMSNTGKLAPTYKLALMNQTPDRFFSSFIYTYSHDKSIEAVARKQVDAAAVDSLVWNYMNRKSPELTSRTRILCKSEPYGIPPIVVSRAVGPEMKRKLRNIFLAANQDEEGKRILSAIMIDRFVVVDDGIYDSVRVMDKWVCRDAGK